MTLVISKGITLRKGFTPESYMYEFPALYPVWSPAEITTALWLDAADASTVTTVSGAVSQWNDKSGNGRNATQTTPSNRPIYSSSSINSKPAIVKTQGSSVDIGLNIPSLGIGSGAARTTVFVFKHINISTTNNELYGLSTTAMLDVGATFQGLNTWRIRNDSNNLFGTAGANTAGDKIMLIRGTSISTDYRQNGGSDLGSAAFDAHAWDTTDGVRLFSVNLPGGFTTRNYKEGAVGEWIVIPSEIDNALAEKLEGYLAHKWGLTADLPSDHPYKTVGPTP
jgi:hypothetical protein